MAQPIEDLKPGENDIVTYYFVTNQNNFQNYVADEFFLDAKYGDSPLHPSLKLIIFPNPKSTELIKDHCQKYAPQGVRLANFKILIPDQTSDSGFLDDEETEKIRENCVDIEIQEKKEKEKKPDLIHYIEQQRMKQESDFRKKKKIEQQSLSSGEEKIFSQTPPANNNLKSTSLSWSVSEILKNEANVENTGTPATVESLLKTLSEGNNSKKRKLQESNETTLMDPLQEKYYSLKKLKTSSPSEFGFDLQKIQQTLTSGKKVQTTTTTTNFKPEQFQNFVKNFLSSPKIIPEEK